MSTGPTAARILITGSAGFIGFHVSRRLLERGASVLGIDAVDDYYDVRLKEARLAELGRAAPFSFRRLDISDAAAVAGAVSAFKPDAVVHLAAQAGVRHSLTHPARYLKSNVDGFLSVLEAVRAHPVRHLVYASSSSVYGGNTKLPFVETDAVDRPVSLYAATKRANELMARTYAHLFAIPCSGLRFFTVYGPWGRPDMAYYSFTRAILEGRPIEVFNDGKLKRDFTYIDDVVEAVVRLIELPPDAARRAALGDPETAPHLLYNVGNQAPVELGTFIAAIERATGRNAVRVSKGMQPGDVFETAADTRRLATVAGFSPATPLDSGLERFVAWYRAFHGVRD
jgi:UDP-glucuronate 4-epimerase